MRSRGITPVAAAVVAAALAIVANPAAAHAATDDGTSMTISSVLSRSALLAPTPVALKNQKSSKFLQPTSTSNNATVVQRAGSSAATQGWKVYKDSGYVTFNNNGVDRNLGTSGASMSSGTAAVIVNGSGSLDQDWLLDKKDDNYFRLQSRKDSRMCLGIDGGSRDAGAVAMIFRCDTSENQTWSFTAF